MKRVKMLLIGLGVLAVLSGALSLTVFNRHFTPTRVTRLMREARIASGAHLYGEAAENYRMVVALRPRKARAYALLSEAYILDGDLESALYYLDMGVEKTSSAKLRDIRDRVLQALPPPEEEEPDETEEPGGEDDIL